MESNAMTTRAATARWLAAKRRAAKLHGPLNREIVGVLSSVISSSVRSVDSSAIERYSWIYHCVHHVGQQVAGNNQNGSNQAGGENYRIIACCDCVDS